jgi:hypothetical protein
MWHDSMFSLYYTKCVITSIENGRVLEKMWSYVHAFITLEYAIDA